MNNRTVKRREQRKRAKARKRADSSRRNGFIVPQWLIAEACRYMVGPKAGS